MVGGSIRFQLLQYSLGKRDVVTEVNGRCQIAKTIEIVDAIHDPSVAILQSTRGSLLFKDGCRFQSVLMPGSFIIAHFDGTPRTFAVDAGAEIRCIASAIRRSRLVEWLEGQPVPAFLRAFLAGSDEPFAQPMMTTTRLLAASEKLVNSPHHGAIGILHRQGALMETLAEILDLFDTGHQRARVSMADLRRAHDARDILAANLVTPPSVDSLARAVGLSVRRLNEAFRYAFGDTVSGCLTEWRLNEGRAQLASGERSVKEVAIALGYTHPSNFVHAYRHRFGVSPGKGRARSQGGFSS